MTENGNGHSPDISLEDFIDDINIGLPPDERGITISSRHAETTVRNIDIIVQSPSNRFETRSDLVRDAVYAYVRAYKKKQKVGDPMLNTHALAEQAKYQGLAARKHHSEIAERMKDIQDQLTLILVNGDLDYASRTMIDYWQGIVDMPLDYWRAQYMRPFTKLAIIKACCRLLSAKGYAIPPDLCTAVGLPVSGGTA